MEKTVLEFTVEKTKELMNASTCCKELKESAQAWLDAVGTEKETDETKKYIAELEDNIMSVDGLISFVESEVGIKHFGAETAANIAKHGKEIKANEAKYCDCPACAIAEAILDKKDELLK
ncbi:MAG: molecular chaperone Hsp90 [Beduini sp.]|uniref:molecular chaperone Hsp90 n=1 Tax=Beduini sp. TaxID=1922300 RepID=UPI0011C7117C